MSEEKGHDKELERIRQKKAEELSKGESRKSSDSPDYPDSPLVVTDSNLDELVGKYPILVVDFWAEWCAPCKSMSAIVDELAEQFSGQIAFGKLNVDQNRQTAMKYEVSSIPQLLIFKNGEGVDRLVGLRPKEEIESQLQGYLQ